MPTGALLLNLREYLQFCLSCWLHVRHNSTLYTSLLVHVLKWLDLLLHVSLYVRMHDRVAIRQLLGVLLQRLLHI